MQTTSEAPRIAAGTRTRKWLGRAILYFVLTWFLLALAGMEGLLLLPFYFLFGWVAHGLSMLELRSLSPQQVAIFSGTLAGFAAGLHLFCTGLFKSRPLAHDAAELHPWPLRRTLACTGLLLVLFGAGIACIGSAHQLSWLAAFREPWIDRMHPHMRASSESRKLIAEAEASHWNTEQIRHAAHARTAHYQGRFQFYIATDMSGEWRGVVVVRNGTPLAVTTRDNAYYNERYQSLDEILRHFAAMEPSPPKTGQP